MKIKCRDTGNKFDMYENLINKISESLVPLKQKITMYTHEVSFFEAPRHELNLVQRDPLIFREIHATLTCPIQPLPTAKQAGVKRHPGGSWKPGADSILRARKSFENSHGLYLFPAFLFIFLPP